MNSSLLFRRQFLLGNHALNIPDWKIYSLNFGLELTAHPDLAVTLSIRPASTLALLGYILDPDHPFATDADIVKSMHTDFESIDSLVTRTDRFSGRWILIYLNNDTSIVLNDAGGMRDVYFTRIEGNTWCGSQPQLLAKYLDIPFSENPDIISYFTPENVEALNYKWSTNLTPYQDIYHLQPNHYLNIREGVSQRFTLNFSPHFLPLHTVTEENCALLTNIMLAAHHRFRLVLGCTAGYDSRVLLAACKQFATEAHFYIFHYQRMAASHQDLYVPQNMFKALSLPFHTIPETLQPEEDFLAAFSQNTLNPRYATLPIIYHLYKEFPGSVNVSETFLSVIKVSFERIGKPDARLLATSYHQPPYPFLLEWMQDWLDKADAALPPGRINFSDLYYWEVHLSNVTSTGATEQDIALEELSPSNCRRLLLNCFSVDQRYHTEPYSYIFHDKMIALMWEELLRFPINPDFKTRIVNQLRKHNLMFKTMRCKHTLKSLRRR